MHTKPKKARLRLLKMEDLDRLLGPLACIGKRSYSCNIEVECDSDQFEDNLDQTLLESQIMDEETKPDMEHSCRKINLVVTNSIDKITDSDSSYSDAHWKKLKLPLGC